MGVFKPLLPVGERPAILRCISAAKEAGVRDVVVVTGNRHDEIEAVLRKDSPETTIARNVGFINGMYSSVLTGVEALEKDTDAFFLLPADCCAVTPEILRMLIGFFQKEGSMTVLHPTYENRRGHPPLIPYKYKDALLSYDGTDGLRGALGALPEMDVDVCSPGVLLDMDTPEDYTAMLRHLNISGETEILQV